jgi:heme exporter protein C
MWNKLLLRDYNKFWQRTCKILTALSIISFIVALIYIFLYSPQDYQQGNLVKIMYVHVPCAWMALFIYSLMGIFSLSFLIWRNQMLDIIAKKAAIIGFGFCIVTLITGSLWGKPIWGAWWVWDARLTSMLILAFIYFSYIAVCLGLNKSPIPSDIPAVLAIVGLINIPIVKWSVNLWTTLHQPASIFRIDGPTVHSTMLLPLMLMFCGCMSYFFALLIMRVETERMQRKSLRLQYNFIKN